MARLFSRATCYLIYTTKQLWVKGLAQGPSSHRLVVLGLTKISTIKPFLSKHLFIIISLNYTIYVLQGMISDGLNSYFSRATTGFNKVKNTNFCDKDHPALALLGIHRRFNVQPKFKTTLHVNIKQQY